RLRPRKVVALEGHVLLHHATERPHIRGDVVTPDHPEYHGARAVWNGAVDRHPAMIVRATGADEVATAVRYARERELPIAGRSGGHGVAGHGTVDGGMQPGRPWLRAGGLGAARRAVPDQPSEHPREPRQVLERAGGVPALDVRPAARPCRLGTPSASR